MWKDCIGSWSLPFYLPFVPRFCWGQISFNRDSYNNDFCSEEAARLRNFHFCFVTGHVTRIRMSLATYYITSDTLGIFKFKNWTRAKENPSFSGSRKNIRIFNGCEMSNENSVMWVTVRHHEACQFPKLFCFPIAKLSLAYCSAFWDRMWLFSRIYSD